jgi:phosphoglycolate phosphatase-like HAD superfamily hydrolase
MGPASLLLLFDIDGTLLLKASREHAEALYAALRRVYGVDHLPGRVEAAGRTDGAIARSLLLLAEVSAEQIDAKMPELRRAVVSEYAHRCPADLTGHLAPGVAELLGALGGGGHHQLALVTGNLEPVARLKVERAGIGHFFPLGQGAFGSDDVDRAALPEIARIRAGRRDAPYPRERTVVIGDTPRDIACARADGVHVIAVATGPFTAEQLKGADAVVQHAGEIPAALAALEAGVAAR